MKKGLIVCFLKVCQPFLSKKLKFLWKFYVLRASLPSKSRALDNRLTEYERFTELLTSFLTRQILHTAMGQSASDFLTPSSSFIIGAGSAFSLPGNYFEFNKSRTPAEADARALRSDWRMVGQDISRAMVRENIKRLAKAGAS